MRIIKTVAGIQRNLDKERSKGKTIGFVPTMGALHDGHMSLVEKSNKENDITVVSALTTVMSFSLLDFSTNDICPSCRAPMVGTKPIVFPLDLSLSRLRCMPATVLIILIVYDLSLPNHLAMVPSAILSCGV